MTHRFKAQTIRPCSPAGSDEAPGGLGLRRGWAVSEQTASEPLVPPRSAAAGSIEDEELPLTGDGQLMASSQPGGAAGAWPGATFSVRPQALAGLGTGPEHRRLDVSSGEDLPLSGQPPGPPLTGESRERRQSPRPALGAVMPPRPDVADPALAARSPLWLLLKDLVACCRDGEYGFDQCAHHAVSVALREQFGAQAEDFRQAARELMDCMDRLGARAEEGGSVRGSIHRGWVAVKGTLAGYSDRSLLAQAERGGELALARYGQALSGPLPSDVRAVLERQADGLRRHLEVMRVWGRRLHEGD